MKILVYFTLLIRITFVTTAELVRYSTASSRGIYIGLGLRIETRTERTTIVYIFNKTQTVRDTGIKQTKQSRITRGSKRQAGDLLL